MRTFLGVDGGGTKTDFLLIDESGRILSRQRAGSAYYLETGIEGLRTLLGKGITATLAQAAVSPEALSFAFVALPAHGEDSRLLPVLDAAPSHVLPAQRYRCGNDMVCGWAGALAGLDGINIVAGTGSIAYGEFAGRTARGGGWGELFSDEGSAYWVAREGLTLFSRMSDGRTARGPLHALLRDHFELHDDLDICAAVYGPPALTRSAIAALAMRVAQAARAGDDQARALFFAAASELAAVVHAVRDRLQVPMSLALPVSYSGGMFQFADLLLEPFRAALKQGGRGYEFTAPRLPPEAGAALNAARLAGTPLNPSALAELQRQLGAMSSDVEVSSEGVDGHG
jgi:N-acetylglucosamine kinase-like BadF-type ATPase